MNAPATTAVAAPAPEPAACRDERLDAMRGLAIVLIVAGHAVSDFHGWGFTPMRLLGGVHYQLPWGPEALAIALMYAFALPVFGFVTGMTLFLTRGRGLDLVRVRAQSLLVPYVSWLLVGTVLLAWRAGIAAVPGNLVLGVITAGASSSLWFLYALFVCICAFAACKDDRALVITAALAPLVMAVLAWERSDFFELRDASALYAPLVAGYLIAKHRPPARWALPAAAVFAATLPLVAAVSPGPLAFGQLPLVPGELLFSLARVACGLAGCLTLWGLTRGGGAALDPLAWLGRRTLGIYVLHPFIVEFAHSHGVTSAWVAATLGLTGATAITLAIERVPLASRLLLGHLPARAPRPEAATAGARES